MFLQSDKDSKTRQFEVLQTVNLPDVLGVLASGPNGLSAGLGGVALDRGI